ncbi:MAG: LVIVD repeat-containing protein [Candidatus Heimdallarchaeota archaeon]
MKKIGQYDTGFGGMSSLFIDGDHIYTTTERGGMVTFNISDISSPSLVSVYDDPTKEVSQEQLWGEYGDSSFTRGIFIEEDIAYLADGSNGLIILNVSSPENPVKIGHYSSEGITNIVVKNNLAFYFDVSYINIIDLSDVCNPTFISKIGFHPSSGNSINDFAIKDNYLFLSSSDLITFDISDPYNPIEVGRLENYYTIQTAIIEDLFFCIRYETSPIGLKYNLSILNIENPLAPIFVGECVFEEADTYIQSMVVSHSFAYVATDEKIIAINIIDETSPVYAGEIEIYSLGSSTKKLELQSIGDIPYYDALVFCADFNKGLMIFNFSSLSNPSLISQHNTGYQAQSLYTTESFAYICSTKDYFSHSSSLEIVSLQNPVSPVLVGRYLSEGTITDVIVHQNLAFLALTNDPSDHSLEIINVSNPANPFLIGYYNGTANLDSRQIDYDATKKIIYLANVEDGFSVINVTNNSQPDLLASYYSIDEKIVDLNLKGDLLFIAGGNYNGGHFRILDVSDPTSPSTIFSGSHSSWVSAIEFDSNMIYLTTYTHPLVIYDATDIFAPKKISYFFNDLFNIPGKVQIKDNFAYIARDMNGLIVLDITNPKRMKSLIEYRPEYSGISKDVTFYKKYILLADGWDGLEILELVPPAISKPIILTMIILPSLVGFSIVVLIVIRTSLNIKKQKTN